MRKKVRLVFINIAVFFGILLLLEGIIRVSYPSIRTQGTNKNIISQNVFNTSNGLTKNYTGAVFGEAVSVDNFHFRKTEVPVDTTKNTVLFLGDSVTMGVGVSNSETFGALTQKEFPSYNIINPSVIGFDTYDYKNVTTTILEDSSLKTKEVVLFFCLNDIYNRTESDASPMLSQKPFIGQIFDFLKSNSYLYIWMKGAFFDRQEAFYTNDANLYTEKTIKTVAKNLVDIADLCKIKGVKFKIIILPYEYQLRNHENAKIYLPQQKLMSHFRSLEIDAYDSSNYMYNNTKDHTRLFLYADGIHFSPDGHQLIAQYIRNEQVIIK